MEKLNKTNKNIAPPIIIFVVGFTKWQIFNVEFFTLRVPKSIRTNPQKIINSPISQGITASMFKLFIFTALPPCQTKDYYNFFSSIQIMIYLNIL